MFRKSRSRANLRQQRLEDSDVEVEEATRTESNAKTDVVQDKVTKTMEKASSVVTKPNNLLSFDDFEGDDVVDFKFKKKDSSKRLDKLAKRAKTSGKKEIDLFKDDDELLCVRQTNEQHQDLTSKLQSDSIKEKNQENRPFMAEDEAVVNAVVDDSCEIPDAQAVYEARKKREQMRRIGSEGQIPLDDVQRLKDKSIARPRIIREDVNDLSDEDDDTGRFYSSKVIMNTEEERRRAEQSDFLAAEQGDDQSDEELAIWESEQMKKGVSSVKVERLEKEREKITLMLNSLRSNMYFSENREELPMEMDIDPCIASSAGSYEVASSVSMITTDTIFSKLQQQILNREQSLNSKKNDLTRIEDNIGENKESIRNLEVEMPVLKERFEMFQELREYVRNLLDCLSEKVSDINNLEKQMYSLLNNRAQKLFKRRRQDIHDVFDECSAAAAGRLIGAMRSAEVKQRCADREARRARRRRARENTGILHEDGLSTDDEEVNSEIVARQQAINEIIETSKLTFVDALDEYARVDQIIARFVDWLSVDSVSFADAYINLCIPRLLSLFIRLEMLLWNPLDNDDMSLSSMKWYESLLISSANNPSCAENPLIVSLIPLCIEKVVLGRITDMIINQWDPLSQKQTRRLGRLLDKLIDECPTLMPSSRAVQTLLKAILEKLKNSIDEDLFIPVYSKQAIENSSSGCKLFLDRQFWTSVKFMRNLDYLNGVISEESMKEVLLDGVVNRCVIALQYSIWNEPSIVRKCQALLKAMPVEWLSENESRTSTNSLIAVLHKISDANKFINREFSKELRRTVSREKRSH